MKVVFLDFDGVLNSHEFFVELSAKPEAEQGDLVTTLSPVCTANLVKLLEIEPELQIVISSTWRHAFELSWLKDKLASHGVDPKRIIGITPRRFSSTRGEEIGMWLADHQEVEHFVILDDDKFDIVRLRKWLVQTDEQVGLTTKDIAKVVKVLKRKYKCPEKLNT